jgi:hypothetical protein
MACPPSLALLYRLGLSSKTVQFLGGRSTIVLESGDFARFSHAGHYASYCRTVQSRRESNGKKKGENNRRNGKRYNRKLWMGKERAYPFGK